jgi:hypothetical protein
MIVQPIPVARAAARAAPARVHAPLRRSLPAGAPVRRVPTAWLLFGAAVVFFDIEVGLAYALHFAARLFG